MFLSIKESRCDRIPIPRMCACDLLWTRTPEEGVSPNYSGGPKT